jgi:hypothetical protein
VVDFERVSEFVMTCLGSRGIPRYGGTTAAAAALARTLPPKAVAAAAVPPSRVEDVFGRDRVTDDPFIFILFYINI